MFLSAFSHLPTHHSFLNVFLTLIIPIISCCALTIHGASNQFDQESLSSFDLSIISTTSHPLNWSLSVDCYTWEGVGCDKYDRVTNLWLPSSGLEGTIPFSFVNLTCLSHLNLSHNRLSGPLPRGFFTSLNRLQAIDLSCNLLSGELSSSFKLPANIKIFNLSSNNFRGIIQSSFLQSASNLRSFDVHNNSFSGSIPSSICNFCPSIQLLDFSDNEFSGPIPQGFGKCTNLQFLRTGFCSNNVPGQIPLDIYGLMNLQELYFPGNKLSEPIQESISNLTNLRILSLYGNDLTGMIPQGISKFSKLEELQLHLNFLQGTIPPSLSNCTKLTILDLRGNNLGGELSAFNFSNFVQLQSIDLAYNQFQGLLPTTLFSCKMLNTIRISSNRLTGHIPSETASLYSLSFLSLSNNSFTNLTSAITILSQCKNLTTLLLTWNFYDEQLPNNPNLIGQDGFPYLQILSLRDCRLTGQVPLWLSYLQHLEAPALSRNFLTGPVPGWLGNLPNLFCIDLAYNQLSGSFPVELTRLRRLAVDPISNQVQNNQFELLLFMPPNNATKLQYNQLSYLPRGIHLGNNHMNGTIPIEIGRMKFILVLDLSNNDFSGNIPETLSDLTDLEKLYLSGNRLSGEIPASLRNLHFLSDFTVADNDLEGPIPTGSQSRVLKGIQGYVARSCSVHVVIITIQKQEVVQ